jgi:hypothetical protein
MMSKKSAASISLALALSACAATPHVFTTTYTEETLPQAVNIEGDNTVSGSAFLRQNGGGVVSCAGNPVVLKRRLSFPRSAYALEVNGLSRWVRDASDVDPRHTAFETQLREIESGMKRSSACDVDGKFEFANLAPGTYEVCTLVYWTVADAVQGGNLQGSVTIPSGASGQKVSMVINSGNYYLPCD